MGHSGAYHMGARGYIMGHSRGYYMEQEGTGHIMGHTVGFRTHHEAHRRELGTQ